MKIVFFGSSKYSTIVEEAIHKKYPISRVITIPERKSGSQILTSPVKTFADTNSIPVITSDKLSEDILEKIKKLNPDFLIVADYGLLLPKELLKTPTKAPLNVHHSLLPKFRGPSPAPSFILSGEKTTGVTVMEMGEGLDTGDILAQKTYDLLPTDTTDSLLTKLNTLGAEILLEVLGDFDTYHKNKKQQDESQATFTKQMTKEDGYFDLSQLEKLSPLEIENWKLKIERAVRAYYPWPTVWFSTKLNGQDLRIKLLPEQKIQVEGKKAVSYKDFINGYPKEGKEILEKLGIINLM